MSWLDPQRQKTIDDRVDNIFHKLGIKQYPYSSIVEIIKAYADKAGITISIQTKDFHEHSYQVFGAIDVNDKNNPIIYLNWNKPSNNQRFTLAHEFGHYILGHTDNKSTQFRIDFESNLYPQDETREKEELEANYFAATLLMPKKLILKNIGKKELHRLTTEDINGLVDFFSVSEHAIRTRLAWIQRSQYPVYNGL